MDSKRPVHNAQISLEEIKKIRQNLDAAMELLERHSAHLNSLDVKRHNSAGIKRRGFIERAEELASVNQEFLPHWLSREKFRADSEHFMEMHKLTDLIEQLLRISSNILIISSDMAYTDSLEFYESVKSALKRGIEPSKTVHEEIAGFFKDMGKGDSQEPTQKKIMKDVKGLLNNTREGVIIVENKQKKKTSFKLTSTSFKFHRTSYEIYR